MRDCASFLVIFGNKPVQQPYAETGAPAPIDLVLRRAHRCSRNVKMGPGRLVDKALQQLRRRNSTPVPATRVLHVGEFRVDHLVVFWPEWHPPDPLADFFANVAKPLRAPSLLAEPPPLFL